MMYTIRIHYTTGDSFGSERTYDEIPMLWCDLETAKFCLQCIKEHHNAVNRLRKVRTPQGVDDLRDEYAGDLWFIDSHNGEEFYNLNLIDDTGNLQRVHAFWAGYFETIHKAEIIIYQEEGESGMSIDFY